MVWQWSYRDMTGAFSAHSTQHSQSWTKIVICCTKTKNAHHTLNFVSQQIKKNKNYVLSVQTTVKCFSDVMDGSNQKVTRIALQIHDLWYLGCHKVHEVFEQIPYKNTYTVDLIIPLSTNSHHATGVKYIFWGWEVVQTKFANSVVIQIQKVFLSSGYSPVSWSNCGWCRKWDLRSSWKFHFKLSGLLHSGPKAASVHCNKCNVL